MLRAMEYKNVLGLISGAMALLAYWIYLKDVFANKTIPHTFSWLIWGLLATTAYFGQVTGKAGAGGWVTGLTALGCLLIFVVAIFKGKKEIRTIDKILLAIASLSIVLLVAVKDARISTTLAILALVIGSFLTMKKAYYKPSQETAKTFALNSIKFIPSIFALSSYSYLTVAYPVSALITNAAIVGVIVMRKEYT